MTAIALETIEENFHLLDEWEDRYRYLIELGAQLPPMDERLKTEETLVRGCTSRVWLIAESGPDKDGGGHFHFTADSDSAIVRGLVFLVLAAYQGKTAAEISAIHIDDIFRKLGLHDHLSPNRRNGFFAMVARIKILADHKN